jgi:hypothetical protein
VTTFLVKHSWSHIWSHFLAPEVCLFSMIPPLDAPPKKSRNNLTYRLPHLCNSLIDNKKTAACKAPEIYGEVVLGRKGRRTCPLAYVVFRSGSGSPARKHDLLYIPYQTPPTIICGAISPVSKSATNATNTSIGRVYVRPPANIAVSGHPVKASHRLS